MLKRPDMHRLAVIPQVVAVSACLVMPTALAYPVLYLHHGLGNTSTERTQRARAPIIIDNLLAENTWCR